MIVKEAMKRRQASAVLKAVCFEVFDAALFTGWLLRQSSDKTGAWQACDDQTSVFVREGAAVLIKIFFGLNL